MQINPMNNIQNPVAQARLGMCDKECVEEAPQLVALRHALQSALSQVHENGKAVEHAAQGVKKTMQTQV